MNNYERKWFARWFPTMDRLVRFKRLYQTYVGYNEKEFFKNRGIDLSGEYYQHSGRLFRYNYPPNSVGTKDTQFIWITKKKIEQAIKERNVND